MTQATLKILYGPPGTGKTWQAAREAVAILKPGTPVDAVSKVHKELVASGQVLWVTFHPSYSYEDFVEGFRPEATDKGVLYTPRPGPFRLACASVTKSAPPGQVFYVGQDLKSTTGNEYVVIAASAESVVVRNVKSGKGYNLETPVSMHVIERLRQMGYSPGDLSLPGSKHAQKVVIGEKVGIDTQTLFGMTGPLRAVWEYVESVLPKTQDHRNVVLVIDEINRADLSRVFGELITMLEQDKRLGQEEERRVILPYSQISFGVPSELHVIGTMNTADRSLAVMDAAFRRRFEFEEIAPKPERCAHPYGDVDIPAVLRGWNKSLRALVSKDVEIGHAYFEVSNLERVSERYGFEGSVDGELRAVAIVLRKSIVPLLADTLRNDWALVDLVLGKDYVTNVDGFIDHVVDTDLEARAAQIVDMSGLGVPAISNWWDPESPSWNPDKFRKTFSQAASS